eukprot:scaffold60578_cov73-Phaeocystis_antarctica.AAC.1
MKHDPKGAATCKSVQGATRLTAVADPPQVRGPKVRQRNAGQKMGEDRSEKSKFQNKSPGGPAVPFCAQCTQAAAKCDGFRDIYNAIKPQFTILQNNSAKLGILGLGLALVEWRARAH